VVVERGGEADEAARLLAARPGLALRGETAHLRVFEVTARR
jgi:hypothetical protein